jgi:hypothetical protein
MKVQFISNLGIRDAREVGLSHAECLAGTIHDFPDDKAKAMLEFQRDGLPFPLVRDATKDTPEVVAAFEAHEESARPKPKTELKVEPKAKPSKDDAEKPAAPEAAPKK